MNNKIKLVISEAIKKVLEENSKMMLSEMALPRKTYKEKIDSLMPQILENWCLAHYCTLSDITLSKNHWVNELRVHLLTVSRFSMKGNDSIDARMRVLFEIWSDNDFNQPQFLNMTIVNKFIEEGIDITSKEYGETLYDCINARDEIFNVIVSRNVEEINKYSCNMEDNHKIT